MYNKIDLEPRLDMITGLVPECNIVCDIGTDHAYIPIRLIQEEKCNKVIATDINEGPIKTALRNISEYGLENRIEARVGNGLDCIEDDECDNILICGMGGLTITDILKQHPLKIEKCNRLIIQCMYANEMVREYCYKKGYDIQQELLCSDKGKLYTAMMIIPNNHHKNFNPVNYYVSDAIFENKDKDLIKRYITELIQRLHKVRFGHKKAKEPDVIRIDYITDIINELIKILDNI